MTRTTSQIALCLILVSAAAWAGDEGTKLLRFPDIWGDEVVFCHGGDLWLAPVEGGTARRLTAHPGQELFPRFSPDGRWIAFTGQYDGDEQVYVVPAAGGEPTRLTWYPAEGPLPPRWGYDNQVYGWTPDGERVLFRSMRDGGGGADSRLYTVVRTGGLPEALPMPSSGAGDLSPDGRRIVYSPQFRDFRHWKRYEGGWAQDLYVFDLASHAVRAIAPSLRTERDPMWIGDTIYLVSDRDDYLNLYAADPGTGAVEQLTSYVGSDVRWASSDNAGRIVYELDGALHVFDAATRDDRALVITVPDDGLWKRPRRISVADLIEDFDLAPGGERAVFVARGEVFSVPIEKGPTRNLTRSSGAHDRAAVWSPDGRTIAFISDASGEDEIWLVDQAGTTAAQRLTDGHAARLHRPLWSPDSERIAFADKDGKLFVVEVEDGREVEVADDLWGAISDYAWSPDGGHLAFSLGNEARVAQLHIWTVGDGRLRTVTSEYFDATSPAWGPDGRYLFYLSNRSYAPIISDLEWNYAGSRRGGIFAMALRKDVDPLLPPESDEVKLAGDDTEEAAANGTKAETKGKGKDRGKADEKKKDEVEPVVIDFEGLTDRVVRIPVEADNYGGLVAVDGYLVFGSAGPPYYGRSNAETRKLQLFSFEDREASDLVSSKVGGWAVSADGTKVLVRQAGGYQLMDVATKGGKVKQVATSGLEMDLVPAEEWAEIFDEAWRRYRDFFYVPNMHGYDWRAIGERYRALLPYVSHRSDLNYVLTEMVAELSAGHTYISGGDYQIPARAVVGLPGARFELDPAAGRYRIASIYRGQNEEPRYRSPLTEVGVDAHEGDYVLAIDGVELEGGDNPYRLLQHTREPVTLTLSDTPSRDGARDVSYQPVASEQPLRYLDWVLGNLERVDELADGRVGYLHIPDMGAPGIAEFIKWYYPQLRKEGLVVDVRSNGGGNVSQWILERLDTRLLGTRFSRTSELPTTYPSTVFYGHLACLISETSASDGDIFPHYFREAGLGPLIGKRTWGGVVGGGPSPLVDGGDVFVPRNATNAIDGSYIIEGHGVDPDIEVENDPASVIAGRDPQLERAVAEVLAAIEREPRRLPERPPAPVKTPAARP